MIRPKLSPRRPVVVAAAALAGLATAFAASSPALATSPSPQPSASPATSAPTATPPASESSTTPAPEGPTCVSAADARYTHKFRGKLGEASITLVNGPLCEGEEQAFALVSYVAPSAKVEFPQYVLSKSVDKFTSVAKDEVGTRSTLKFKVEVPTCYTQVDFVFGDEIIDPLTDSGPRYGDRKVGSPKGIGSQSKGPQAWYNGGGETCEAAPEVVVESDCAGKVTFSLINRDGNAPANFVIATDKGFSKAVTVPLRSIEKVELDAAAVDGQITVTANEKSVWTGTPKAPAECQEPEVGEPETSYESTCDELVLLVQNPKNGVSLTSTFTPSTGKPQTVTIEPGTNKSVRFPAAKGLTVVVTGDLESAEPIKWTAPLNGCDEGGTGGGEEGGLPVTGAAAGGIAAGAVALLAAGAVLFVVARRRRIRFTS
ncbi:cell wall anchor protein [Micromonospora sp. NBC_01655]|uniref:cell wall anchor protein n=1 Tax=Micromonospora sp. NBC_01655 TaxID=2975983 RepID=UPI002259E938|nr:cell wall anchor protein [Micromonospora sp. NBC_01655]MCX4473949.1 cell wall anchor protein [Micromonospora sp. NBC_01655]